MNVYPLQVEYKKQKEWAGSLMWMEMALGAIAGGLFVVSLFLESALGLIIAVVLMLVGKGVLLFAELGRPGRAFKVLMRPGASWISRGAWALLLFVVVGAICVLPLLVSGLPWSPWTGIGKVLGIIGAILAVFLILYDGFFLGSAKGISFWSNASLPLLFGASAFVGGLGALTLIALLESPAYSFETLAVANSVVLGLTLLTLFTFLRFAHENEGGAKVSSESLIKGELSMVFWMVTVVIGLVVPLVVSLIALSGLFLSPVIWAAVGLLEIVGVFTLRSGILRAGVYSPLL